MVPYSEHDWVICTPPQYTSTELMSELTSAGSLPKISVPLAGVAEVVSRSMEILKVFRSKVALLGSVNWMIEVGPAEVAPLVSKTKRFRLNPVRAAVAKATSLGITSILIRSQNKIILRGVAKLTVID